MEVFGEQERELYANSSPSAVTRLALTGTYFVIAGLAFVVSFIVIFFYKKTQKKLKR